jgi:predicted Zn-dependent protease with MMP-like domain
MSISDERFERYVDEAVARIPAKYADVHRHVIFQIADEPTPEQRQQLKLRPDQQLFGLFHGVNHMQRAAGSSGILPAVITIFKHPMVDIFTTEPSLQKQVNETVWHEVAHYFGLNHQAMHEIERHGGSTN